MPFREARPDEYGQSYVIGGQTQTPETTLLERVKAIAPGFYTERDAGPWYVIAPGGQRIAEDFHNRDDARRLICFLAGDPLPAGWDLVKSGTGDLAADIVIPNRPRATLWLKATRTLFPDRISIREG